MILNQRNRALLPIPDPILPDSPDQLCNEAPKHTSYFSFPSPYMHIRTHKPTPKDIKLLLAAFSRRASKLPSSYTVTAAFSFEIGSDIGLTLLSKLSPTGYE